METSDFLEEVAQAFAPLIGQGLLEVVSSSYLPEAFGNASVILAGGRLRVRLVRDRGDVSADVCDLTSEEWTPLQRAIRAVLNSSDPPDMLLTPAEAASMIEGHYGDFQEGYSPERITRTKSKLAELNRQAEKEVLARLKVRPS